MYDLTKAQLNSREKEVLKNNDDKEFMMKQISEFTYDSRLCSERLFNDKEIAMHTFITQKDQPDILVFPTSLLKYMPEHLKNDGEVIKVAVAANLNELRYVPDPYKDEPKQLVEYFKHRRLMDRTFVEHMASERLATILKEKLPLKYMVKGDGDKPLATFHFDDVQDYLTLLAEQ